MREIYKVSLNDVLASEKISLQINYYDNINEKLKYSIKKLELLADDKFNEKNFVTIMKIKETVYQNISNMYEKLELYLEKRNQYSLSNDDEDLLEFVYLQEDITSSINNNVYIKFLLKNEG